MSKADPDDRQIELTHARLMTAQYRNRFEMAYLQLEDANKQISALKAELAAMQENEHKLQEILGKIFAESRRQQEKIFELEAAIVSGAIVPDAKPS